MRRIVLFFTLIACTTLSAKELTITPDYYTYPMVGAKRLYSATFGEMRPDHFHSGVDIKTDGVEGKSIVAAADGYISRIGLSSGGFGLVLYVAHPNGTTTVYAHLKSLRPDIERYLKDKRYELKQHSLNLYPEAELFPVKKGQEIALSGNSGSSMGPHLHFELRDSRNQKPLNAVKLGVITPTDNIRPRLKWLYYTEFDERDGVRYYSGLSRYELVRVATGEYRIKGRNLIWSGRKGIFILAATDFKNDVWNSFGLYRLTAQADGTTFFEYEQNGFTFDMTRYSNAVNYYPLQIETSDEVYRLARLAGAPTSLYKTLKGDGVISTAAGEQHKIVITAEDDMQNISTLRFTMRGKDDKDCYKIDDDKVAKRVAHNDAQSIFTDKNIKLTIAPGALYESVPYRYRELDIPHAKVPEGVKTYGEKGHAIMDYTTPLHKFCTLSIAIDIPESERPHACLAYITRKGDIVPAGGSYKDGNITAQIRSGGCYFVVSDTIAPTITTEVTDGQELTRAEAISFTVEDNFSGLASYSATLDGEWIALEQRGKTLTHIFRGAATGQRREIELTVSDGCGNKSVINRCFVR